MAYNLNFAYNSSTNSYKVTGATGTGTSIVIPSTYNGPQGILDVTIIDLNAFAYFFSLSSVTIPDTIIEIRQNAFFQTSIYSIYIPKNVSLIEQNVFANCNFLTSITVDIDNETYYSDSGILYNKDQTTLLVYPPGKNDNSFTIPNQVQTLGPQAMRYAIYLTTINIPQNVISADVAALPYAALQTINVDSQNPNYSSEFGVFYNKNKTSLLKYPPGKQDISFNVPNIVTSIHNFGFQNVSILQDIIFSNNLTSIGVLFCEAATSLQKIFFLGNAPSLGVVPFNNTNANLKIYRYSTKSGWSSTFGGKDVLLIDTPSKGLRTFGFPNISSGKISIKKQNLGGGIFSIKKSPKETYKAFFPVMGNHDYDDIDRTGIDYLNYFPFLSRLYDNTSNKSKYYDIKIDDCHFFVLDSDPVCGSSDKNWNIFASYPAGKGDSNTASNSNYAATQKTWFNNAIKNSNSKYKFVFYHHPSYTSSSYHRGHPKLSPHQGWKVHLANEVFHGHEHLYERIVLPSQLPQHIQVTKISNQLKIEYNSQGNLHGTSQLRIHIGNDGWQNIIDANTAAGYMEKINNVWTFYYNIPNNADYINFVFRSNGSPTPNWESNTINNENYDYIYYLNDSNNFNSTTYSIVGNGGINLRNHSNTPILGSQSRIGNKYGFTKVSVYENGFKNEHYGIGFGENNFSIVDSYSFGDTTTQIKFTFATLADWGKGNGGAAIRAPSSSAQAIDDPGNYYVNLISQEIRNQNINYVFGVGDMSYTTPTYPYVGYKLNASTPVYIDENIGRFFSDYITDYKGIYSNGIINSNLLSIGTNSIFYGDQQYKYSI